MSNNNVTDLHKKKTVHELGLHEHVEIEAAIVTRVPGGWLYSMVETFGAEKIVLPPVFVPYNSEFK